MQRAQRRSDKERMKKKARKLFPHDKDAKLADHLASCSCHMCGNARKHYGHKTMQEVRSDLALKIDMENME